MRTFLSIAALKSRCKYWDVLHPVFVDRTSSRPTFTADNLGDDDVAGDLFNRDEDDLDDDPDDNNDNNDNDGNGGDGVEDDGDDIVTTVFGFLMFRNLSKCHKKSLNNNGHLSTMFGLSLLLVSPRKETNGQFMPAAY